MMADAFRRDKRIGKKVVVVTAIVTIATAAAVSYFRTRKPQKPLGDVVRAIREGDPFQRMLAIRDVGKERRGDAELAQIFPLLIEATKDDSDIVRDAAASVLGGFVVPFDDARGSKKRDLTPTLEARRRKAEEALAALLKAAPPTRGCDLQLMSGVADPTGIPTEGKNLVIVADVDHVLHFRVFDGAGKRIVDSDERRLTDRGLAIITLKKRIENKWPPHELTKSEKDELIAGITDVVDRTVTIRDSAVKSLALMARLSKLNDPPSELVACLDDESEQVRVDAVTALIQYAKGPELIVPVAIRRIPTETPKAHYEFDWLFWQVRLEPSILPVLIEGLSAEKPEIRLCCAAAINHMGRPASPALPAILKLLRAELDAAHDPSAKPRERLIGMAAGAIGEIGPDRDPSPESVRLLCEVLKLPSQTKTGSEPAGGGPASANASALDPYTDMRLAEAAWSLGILGRAASSSVPLLISTFEAPPTNSQHVRDVIAEALVEITRGTPDEDRVIAMLAKAWQATPPTERVVFARALRNLGPKSEQAVPDLKQFPRDESRTNIRRVRYPRSQGEQLVRE